jgi:hypothetical protein
MIPERPNAVGEAIKRNCATILVLLVLIVLAGIRFRLRSLPLERDEGEYAYAGQLILEGIPPYKLAYNMKFPGTYAAYAAIMAVFGQSPSGIHLGIACVTFATALLFYLLCQKIFDDDIAAVSAVVSFAVVAATPEMAALAAHATHFCSLFVTAGLFVMWPSAKARGWTAGLAGLFFGLAVLMKQQAVFFCLWALLVFTWTALFPRQSTPRRRLGPLVAFCAGAALPLLVCFLVLWQGGVLPQFWFWTIHYAAAYVSEVPAEQILHRFFYGFSEATAGNLWIWLLAGTGFAALWIDECLKKMRLELSGFILAAVLSLCPGFFFRRHYFVLILPAVGILIGCVVHSRSLWPKVLGPSAKPIVWTGLAAGMAFTVWAHSSIWFILSPLEVTRLIYGNNPFPEAELVASFIKSNSRPSSLVAVLGSEPEIYFLAHRHSATGYIYTYPLTEAQPYAERMQREMIQEITSAQPDFVVTATDRFLLAPSGPNALLDWWAETYRTNFNLVGAATRNPPFRSRLLSTDEAATATELPRGSLLIYQRSR